MADYHMLNDGVFGVGGSDIMDDTANLVNAVSFSSLSPSVNTAGQGMMSQNIPGTPGQNPNVMQMQGMVQMQQQTQGSAQLPSGGMTSYHQGTMHGYTQSEVPQKLHQYSVYGSQLQTGNMAGQYMPSGPRLHHLNDPMSSIPDQQQQSSPRTVVPNQVYQNRNMASNQYSQQIPHGNTAPAQMTQGTAQYPGHYGTVPQLHTMQQQPAQQQHTVQQVNQSPDLWQNSMPHSQMNRPNLPATQNYPQHQMVPNQHGNNSMNHSPMMMQGQRPSTPNQSQYISNQEYAPQQPPIQRPPVYNMNSSSVNQNGSMVGQMSNAPQSGLSQNMSSIPQTEQAMTFSQGHYGASQTPANRPHYNTNSAMGSTVGLSSQQHVMGQQMMNVRQSVHQMGYSVPPRMNSGQQHAAPVPPGSPARLQQYHPPYSPNQTYTAAQPSPRPNNPESGTPPHLHYSSSQPHVQTQSPQMSPQYRSPFPSQVTHSPQHLTPTPPAEVSVPLPHTPERVLQSSTPQSQGSYHSPSTTHLTSPGQGQSPGSSSAPSSLQHLEQMVLPRSTCPTTTPVASAVSTGSTNTTLNSGVGGNYYTHLSNSQHPQQQPPPPPQQQQQQQQHHMHITPVGESRPQPQSPAAFSQMSQAHSQHTYLNQTINMNQQQTPSSVSNVPNSQPLQANAPVTLSNSALLSDDSTPLDSNQLVALSYGSDNSSSMPSVTPSVNSAESASVSVSTSINSNISSMSTSDPLNSNSCAPVSTNEPTLQTSQQYNVHASTSYQGNSIAFEMQQIQQELQQLYNSLHQSPETLEKMKALQERLRYLQSQKNASTSNAAALNNVTPMSPHYQRPMMYNSGSVTSYGHQPMMQQPHTVHYNPPNQPPVPTQDMGPSQQNLNAPNLPIPVSDNSSIVPEQVPLNPDNMAQSHYPTPGSEGMPPFTTPEKADMPNDPYEMTFNDEPPPKLKRRTPKEPKPKKPPKSPKTPKEPKEPKEPKPKKPRKGKNAAAAAAAAAAASASEQPPNMEGQPGAMPVAVPNMLMETSEGGENPLGEVPPIVPAVAVTGTETPAEAKPKKSRKRKKDDDGQPKEPKPKKPRKKPEKKPKQPKEGDAMETSLKEGENVELPSGENVTDSVVGTEDEGKGAKESIEGSGTEKDTKEKKSKSKSPKTKDGTPKEPKKSTPKKKLPKIALKFTSKKKKKKALQIFDNSDIEKTPPPSPTEGDGITKRRSARNTERKKYTDDIELHLSDDETIEMDFNQNKDGKLVQTVADNHAEDYMLVEKILAIRTVKKQLDGEGSGAENNDNEPVEVEVEEYFVKYKNLSYIHCEWKTLEELEKGDRRFIQKVKRFKQKKETFNFFDFLEEEPFNPDYIEVDRVLDVNEVKEPITDITGENDLERLLSEVKDNADGESVENKSSLVENEAKSDMNLNTCTEKEKLATNDSEPPSDNTESPTDNIEPLLNNTDPPLNDIEPPLDDTEPPLDDSEPPLDDTEPPLDNTEPPSDTVINVESKSEPDPDKNISETASDVVKIEEPVAKDSEEKSENDLETKNEDQSVINEEDPSKYKVTRHYLVKWRGLTYEESTWELEDDVDRDKIEQFLRFKEPPPKEKWKQKKRPRPAEWNQLPESPVYKGGNTLREYQLEGVNWLTFCWYNSQNCILADEMGLGKTIQSITFLNEIDQYGIPGPFLVIAPLSTIGNWQREFETWTDLNAITYHGSSPSRNMILEYEMYWKDEKGERIQDVYKFQVMITTFEIILTDCMELKSIPWRCVIIDEAHRLKNRNCKLLEGLRMLNTEHRVLLTGTPLQNNVEELFSLLNFLEPNRFASTEAFLEEFGNLKTESQVDKLKAILKPMMLRRLKEDVEKSLAPKEETVVEVELTNIQKKYYRAILERNFTFLTKGNCYSNIPNLMNTMMELRKCCIHPFLINGAEEQIINDYRMQHEDSMDLNLNAMVQASGKLVLMDKLLPRLRTDDHRVLVFSQMVRCLDILEDYLIQKRYPYERIDGRVRGNLRQAAIDRFCKPDSDRFVFLLCTRAGGLGINLTAADTVIIFDSDWNPQNDLQAQARCHRIGQSKAVKVYRLICRNTYEREMFDKASLKLGLDKAVLQSMSMKENVGMNQQMSKKEIEDLLRKGAYGALMEDDNAGDKFCEEDIDQILQRRTQVITLESGTKGSTFSKATFASASTRSDIEIDDPNFWEKWAKKANLDVDELKNRNELIIEEPRRRTQTRRFGTDDLIDLSDLDTSDEDDDNISSRTRGSKKGSKHKNKNGRGRDDDYMDDIPPGNWTRAECYKMEKGLLTFGWGRWDECMGLVQFRRRMTHKDCEDIARVVLLYCLLHYKGDEKIKSFIWDLICPNDDGEERIHKNHSESENTVDPDVIFDGYTADYLGKKLSFFGRARDPNSPVSSLNIAEQQGLSAPVPRGRKGKKIKKETKTVDQIIEESEWTKEEISNPDCLLNDEIYKRHLNRHSNKVLLRVRLLYYLKHEIIGDLHDQVFSGLHANEIPLFVPPCEGEPPAPWWDQELDKSLLLGIYKHGFERYNIMRQDPRLCFLSRCGPPDGAALLAELQNSINNEDDIEDQAASKDKDEEMEPMSPSSEAEPTKPSIPNNYLQHPFEMGGIQFPSVTDVNTRVRRLVTAFQRNNKRLEIRNAQKAKKIERREKFEAAIREREMKKRELQQRKWSRREEADFYRTISAFGVEYNQEKKEYNWSRFRGIARLERKYDETLAEYYKCFYAMCKRVCGRELTEEEEQLAMNVEPISEERASRCLQRVELLNKIREEILCHPELDERLKLCQPSMDLPDWWVCGKHDKDLLIGAAKHGLSRMDYHLLHDPNLSFKDVLKNYPNAKTIQIGNLCAPLGCPSPINIYQTEENGLLKEDGIPKLKEEIPILSDEMAKRDDTSNKNEAYIKSESDKDKNDENSAPPLLLPNSYDNKDSVDIFKESMLIKTEVIESEIDNCKAQTEVLNDNTSEKVSNIEESKNELKEFQLEQPSVSEVNNEASSLSEEKTLDVNSTVNKTEDKKIETTAEIKTEDELKEDDETDIETDLRKEEDDQKEANTNSDESIKTKISHEPVLSAEEPENDDKKYDCDTDTEIKYDTSQIIEKDHFSIKKEHENNQDKSSEISEKDFLIKSENISVDTKDSKIITKDDILHSHVEDSQMKLLLQGCISQNDDIMSQASYNFDPEMGEPTVAQLLAFSNGNAVRWPKDKVLQIRLEHIVHAVEKNEWPIIRHTFLPTFPNVPSASTPIPHPPVIASPVSHRASPVPSVSSQGHSGEVTPQATPEHTPQRDPLLPDIPTPSPAEFSLLHKNPLPHSIPTPPLNESSKSRKRRRRRRFEIEAERAKLRQLLSHNMQQQQHHHQQQLQHVQNFLASSSLRNKIWEDHIEDKVPHPTVPSPAPTVPAVTGVPPPAHQNSSPRMSTSLGSLDLRVKPSITPPTPFTPLPVPQKGKTPPIETPPSSNTSPTSPIDLSASSGTNSNTPASTPQPASNQLKLPSKTKEKRGARGGSRIDALALNLQARKQQQMMQEQHHPLADIGSMLERTGDKSKEHSESEEPQPPPMPRHHSHHHVNRRNIEDEEAKLRKKRMQYSEESARKTLNRGFETPSPAHSSYASLSNSSNRLNLNKGSSKTDEQHSSNNNPVLDPSALMHHDFKKWIDDHPELLAANPNLVAAAAAAMALNSAPSFHSHTELLELPEGRRRGRRPRLDPSKLDYDKITGEENVSVINRLTGKKITGSKAPPLKYLAEWLDKNPMFDVDPKWGPLVREKGNLPNTLSKRIVTPSEKRGRRTAASLLANAHQNLVPPVTTMSFPSTAGLNPLNFANTGMLSGFPNMKFFMDPSKSSTSSSTTTSTSTTSANHPIFLPFGGLAGMGLTNPLFGFPGFNFPGLQGSSPLGTSNLPSSKDHKDSEKSRSDKDTGSSSSRKNAPASSSTTAASMSSASSLPSSSLPFLYPPGLLYNPLGLGGFTLPPNLPGSFGSFSQSGLVNGLGLSNPLFTTSSLNTTLSSSLTTATVTSSAAQSILSSAPSAAKSLIHASTSKLLNSQSHFTDGQETDDESLKSLMGNHDDDDDDLDDSKMEIYDNLDKDDSDKETFRDVSRRSPASSNASAQPTSKNTLSDSEGVSLAKTTENTSIESINKSRGMHDDPTSDSTDTESKHS